MSDQASAETVQALLANVIRREVIGEGKGYSGVPLERVTLSDGRVFILKTVSPQSDISMRITKDRGRAATLWTGGYLQRLPPTVEHATEAVAAQDNGWLLVMRDVSAALFPPEKTLTARENRRILGALVKIHKTFEADKEIPDLCALSDYIAVLSPRKAAEFKEQSPEFANWTLRGWDNFDELAPQDIVAAIAAIHDNPAELAAALEQRPTTLIHGDPYIENLGLFPDRAVLIDWSLACRAPSAVDFTAYLSMNGLRLEETRDQALDDYRQIAGDIYDEKALHLAILAALASYGWRMAMYLREWGTRETMPRIEEEFAWWLDRARQALQIWSPRN